MLYSTVCVQVCASVRLLAGQPPVSLPHVFALAGGLQAGELPVWLNGDE